MRAAVLPLVLVGCVEIDLPIHFDLFQDDPARPSRVEVWLDAGHVDVVAGDDASIERRLRWQGDVAPVSEVHQNGGTLVIDGRCPPRAVGCAIDVSIVVPEGTVLEVFTGGGDVTVKGLSGDVFVDTAAGVVDLDLLTGQVIAYTSEGTIRGQGLGAPRLEVEASGFVDLAFATPPAIVDVRAGDHVAVAVPSGSYRLELAADRGEVVVTDVLSDDAAPNVIVARAVTGDVTVSGHP